MKINNPVITNQQVKEKFDKVWNTCDNNSDLFDYFYKKYNIRMAIQDYIMLITDKPELYKINQFLINYK